MRVYVSFRTITSLRGCPYHNYTTLSPTKFRRWLVWPRFGTRRLTLPQSGFWGISSIQKHSRFFSMKIISKFWERLSRNYQKSCLCQFYLYSPKSQLCFQGLYNPYNILKPLVTKDCLLISVLLQKERQEKSGNSFQWQSVTTNISSRSNVWNLIKR